MKIPDSDLSTAAPSALRDPWTAAPSARSDPWTAEPSSLGDQWTVAPSALRDQWTVAPSALRDSAAERFGRYELLRRLGAGGMAEVFLAREPLSGGLSKILVIKKIHAALARTPAFQRMFEEEARIAVNLNHPSVVQIFNYGKLDDTLFLAMEHVDGLDLLRLLHLARAARRPVPRALAAYLIAQVCKGLDYAHRKRDEQGEPLWIVHRDVSPQNVLLSFDGAVKLADFGIARNRDTQEDAGVLKGKYAYMSPEQAMGHPVDHRSDIYSVGVVLFEATTGHTLYGNLPVHQALAEISAGKVPHPRDIDPGMPAELERILIRALQPRREDRHQTARDLQNDLGRFYFSHADGEVIDSGRLAAFIAGLALPDERLGAQKSPLQVAPTASPAGSLPPPRQQHNVVVVEGVLLGLPLLRRTIGEARTRSFLLDLQRATENLAYKHRAHMERFDENGFTCVVGIPHEEEHDAVQAIRLALAEIEALEALVIEQPQQQHLAIGVQRGVALVSRKIGSDPRAFALEIAGATAELARRLSKSARPGEVLTGGSVYRAARGAWRFEAAAPLELPPEPGAAMGPLETLTRVRVYRLLGGRVAGEVRSRPPQHFGRDREITQLKAVLAEAGERKQPRHALVVGEVGMGKKTLLSAFRASLDPAGHMFLRAAAREATRDVPFSLLATLARDFLGLTEHSSRKEILLHLDAAIRFLSEEDRRSELGAIDDGAQPSGAPFCDSAQPSGAPFIATERRLRARQLVDSLALLLRDDARVSLVPAMRRGQVHVEALHELFSYFTGERTLVLALEEVQWADSASLSALAVLSTDRWIGRAVVFVSTLRSQDDVPGPVREWLERRRDTGLPMTTPVMAPVTVIDMQGLSVNEQEVWILSRLAPGPAREEAAPLCRQIIEKAGGNPLYLSEILDSLIERGCLKAAESGEGLFWATQDQAIAVPTTVEALIAAQLDRLPDGQRQCLLLLAHWQHTPLRPDAVLLGELLGRAVEADLDALQQRKLVDRLPDGSHGIRTSIVADVVRATVPEAESHSLRLRLMQLLSPGSGPEQATVGTL